jgi:hypothetical protein
MGPDTVVVEHKAFVREGPEWPVPLAKLMAEDTYLHIEEGHAGFAKSWKATGQSLKNSTVGTLKKKWRGDKKQLAITVGVGVVFLAATITVSIFTGGLGIPVLMGIAAGAFALKKAVAAGLEKAFVKRNNLNWLKYFDTIKKTDAVELEKDFSSNAADAVRRLVDHYRQAANLKSSLNHWRSKLTPGGPPGIGPGKVACCDDAVNLILTMARFRYQLNKSLNYSLCCMHTAILSLNNYIQLCNAWNGVYGVLENMLVAHIETCDHHVLCKNACYGPLPPPLGKDGYSDRIKDLLRIPKKPLPVKKKPAAPGKREHIELNKLRQKLYERALKFEKTIEASPDKMATPEEIVNKAVKYAETELKKANKVLGITDEIKASKDLIVRMVNDCYKKVDDKGIFTEMGHFVQSWYRRKTATEKGLACASVFLEAGLALVGGSLSGADSLGHLASKNIFEVFPGLSVTAANAIKGGATGLEMLALDVILTGVLTSSELGEGTGAMKSALLEERAYGPTEKEKKELDDDKKKKAGAAVQAFFQKASHHYIEAEKLLKEIQKKGEAFEIKTCDDAIAAAEPFYEFVHHMDKVAGYTVRAIGLVFFLAEDMEKWIADEPVLWQLAQEQCAEWFVSCRHQLCREKGTYCYGPKFDPKKAPDYKTPQKPL